MGDLYADHQCSQLRWPPQATSHQATRAGRWRPMKQRAMEWFEHIKSAIQAEGTFFLTACHKNALHVNVASFS